jgi:hypothetical protein
MYCSLIRLTPFIAFSFPHATFPAKRKYIGINLTKKTKDVYHEKYKALKKEVKEDIRR